MIDSGDSPRSATGVTVTPKALFFAVAEGGEILDVEPQRVEIPDGLRRASNLKAMCCEHRRLLVRPVVLRIG